MVNLKFLLHPLGGYLTKLLRIWQTYIPWTPWGNDVLRNMLRKARLSTSSRSSFKIKVTFFKLLPCIQVSWLLTDLTDSLMSNKYNPSNHNVSSTISRSKAKGTWVDQYFCSIYFVDRAYLANSLPMWHRPNPWNGDVLITISRLMGQTSRSQGSFKVFSMPNPCPCAWFAWYVTQIQAMGAECVILHFQVTGQCHTGGSKFLFCSVVLPIWRLRFVGGSTKIHKGMMCRVPFPTSKI